MQDIGQVSHWVCKKRIDTSTYSTLLSFRPQQRGVKKSQSDVVQAALLWEISKAYKRSKKGCGKTMEHFFTSLFKHIDTFKVEEMNRFCFPYKQGICYNI